MNPTGGSVDEFIATVPSTIRQRDALTLLDMMREISGREPQMWGTIIGFGSCHYEYPTGGSGDMPLIAFSPRAASMSVYLMSTADHVAELAQVGPHTVGKSCLYLKNLEKNNIDVLRTIITDSFNRVVSEETSYGTIRVDA